VSNSTRASLRVSICRPGAAGEAPNRTTAKV
jgi:hypothetical protein